MTPHSVLIQFIFIYAQAAVKSSEISERKNITHTHVHTYTCTIDFYEAQDINTKG